MEKKYELTDEIVKINNHTLHRIKALKDFGDVKKGDLGGWVESEDNLSHKGNAWVYDGAKVFGMASVGGKSRVYGEAKVYGGARVFGEARIFGRARVCGGAWVFDKARVEGEVMVLDEAIVFGKAWISEGIIGGNTKIYVPRYFSVLWYLKREN